MDARQIEAYSYYKRQYPQATIVFHLIGRYVAIFNEERIDVFPDDNIEKLSKLGDTYEIRIIEYRNDAGELDFPDIKQIQEDKRKDY